VERYTFSRNPDETKRNPGSWWLPSFR
jgi:hypothetical protein